MTPNVPLCVSVRPLLVALLTSCAADMTNAADSSAAAGACLSVWQPHFYSSTRELGAGVVTQVNGLEVDARVTEVGRGLNLTDPSDTTASESPFANLQYIRAATSESITTLAWNGSSGFGVRVGDDVHIVSMIVSLSMEDSFESPGRHVEIRVGDDVRFKHRTMPTKYPPLELPNYTLSFGRYECRDTMGCGGGSALLALDVLMHPSTRVEVRNGETKQIGAYRIIHHETITHERNVPCQEQSSGNSSISAVRVL
jgi:hypothetical protein